MSGRLEQVLARLDALNAEDPSTVIVDGKPRAKELAFADRLEAWIRRLKPDPSEELRIAARGQHVRRWAIPRSAHPDGRGGYLRWREELRRLHAATVRDVMRAEGYAPEAIARAAEIVMKRNLAGNPDAQTMEDALCLVFLETQFEDLREKTPDEKMAEIIRKTWRKMSAQGREAALSLEMPSEHRAFIERALSVPPA